MRPGHNHPSSIYASWSRLTNSCFDGKNEYPTFSWLGHVKYAPGVCATVRPLRAEPKAPMDCMGQSSFETGYAPGMRQPHSSLVILFQLEHGEDPATVRPLNAEVPAHPLCWFLSKSKYALGTRWTFFRPRTRLTYAPEVCARLWGVHANSNKDTINFSTLCAEGMRKDPLTRAGANYTCLCATYAPGISLRANHGFPPEVCA